MFMKERNSISARYGNTVGLRAGNDVLQRARVSHICIYAYVQMHVNMYLFK